MLAPAQRTLIVPVLYLPGCSSFLVQRWSSGRSSSGTACANKTPADFGNAGGRVVLVEHFSIWNDGVRIAVRDRCRLLGHTSDSFPAVRDSWRQCTAGSLPMARRFWSAHENRLRSSVGVWVTHHHVGRRADIHRADERAPALYPLSGQSSHTCCAAGNSQSHARRVF